MRTVVWSPDAERSLEEILDYYVEKMGIDAASKVSDIIRQKIELLSVEEGRTQLCLDLKDIGIGDVYQLTINPWIVYYKISPDNKQATIVLVVDGRRNLEELLTKKAIDGKI
jgi:plasmid stabilization system protein ParE